MERVTLLLIPVALVFLALAGFIAWVVIRSQRSQKLRQKFGPEYDYTLEKVGDRRAAEEHLSERERRIDHLNIRTLDRNEWTGFNTRWIKIQSKFVDEPATAVYEANELIKEVMVARGFPVTDFDQRAEDISVLYPSFVSNYRNAHTIAMKGQRDGVSTEEYRQAMVYYRSLFDELLESDESNEKEEVG